MTNKATLGLIDPKSPSNIGGILRASGCYQVDTVFYSGQRFNKVKKFHTDTQKSALHIPLLPTDSLLSSVPTGAKIVCIDLVEGAVALPEYTHPENAYYIFGPEDGTISQEIIDNADDIVYIPTIGCMNLAATVNVVLYDRLAKSSNRVGGDDLIRASRDTNNRAKVKAVEA